MKKVSNFAFYAIFISSGFFGLISALVSFSMINTVDFPRIFIGCTVFITLSGICLAMVFHNGERMFPAIRGFFTLAAVMFVSTGIRVLLFN